MAKTTKIIKFAIASAVAIGIGTLSPVTAMAAKYVKCYGVAKAGKNDCGSKNAGHSCQGNAKVDYDPSDWVAVKSKKACTSMKIKTADGKTVRGSLVPGHKKSKTQ